MRLIDADALANNRFNMYSEFLGKVSVVAAKDIENAPTIDAVPVVQCKDCARQKKGFCTIRKDSFGATLLVGEHDFCSDGERKNDGR